MSTITHNPVLPFKWESLRDYLLGLGMEMNIGELLPALSLERLRWERSFFLKLSDHIVLLILTLQNLFKFFF